MEPARGAVHGHERSPRIARSRRSDSQRSRDQTSTQEAGRTSSLTTWTAASPPGSGHEAMVTEDGPHPTTRVEPTARPGTPGVILDGRATSVPFTTVLNGPKRTTTDNHEAASTCAVPHPLR
jgi:hypothetical protein